MFILKLTEEIPTEKIKLVTIVTPICAAVLIFEFAVTANTVYFTLNERYEKTYGLCLRLVDRLE